MDEKPMALCACGCGTTVRSKWVRGHHSRVNNVSQRSDIKEKRRQSMKKRHEDGIMPEPWNKGKTVADDERIASYGRTNSSIILSNEEETARRSEQMKKQWEEGNLKPLSGPDHSQWRGGTSRLTERLRSSHRLYKLWKLPILQRDGYRCTVCRRGSDEVQLAVHHDGERFASIVRRHMPPYSAYRELTFDESTVVMEAIVSYHLEYEVSGITLCYECHDLAHEIRSDSDL